MTSLTPGGGSRPPGPRLARRLAAALRQSDPDIVRLAVDLLTRWVFVWGEVWNLNVWKSYPDIVWLAVELLSR